MTDTQRATPDYLALAEKLEERGQPGHTTHSYVCGCLELEAAAALREAAGEIARLRGVPWKASFMAMRDERNNLRVRAEAAEKKLEQVRAWAFAAVADGESFDGSDHALSNLAAILDQQETE